MDISANDDFIWKDDSCLICRTLHESNEEKSQHVAETSHKKKQSLYNFLSKDLQFVRPDAHAHSMLYDRYAKSQAPVIGLNYVVELNFPWSNVPYWLCGLCCNVGYGLDSADIHLHSSCHRRNFISEVYPDRFQKLLEAQQEADSTKHSNLEHEEVLKILKEKSGIGSPPDVYHVVLYEKHVALEKLTMKDEDEQQMEFNFEEITDNHQIFNCEVCSESIMTYTDPEQHKKVYESHCATMKHQRCQMMIACLKEASVIKTPGYPEGFVAHDKLVWASEEDVFYGPTCGIEFLVNFGDDNFCKLCNCLVSREEASNHFSCESHVANYLKRKNPSELFNIEYFQADQRRNHFIELLTKEVTKANGELYYYESKQGSPKLLKNLAFPEDRIFRHIELVEKKLGEHVAHWCEMCQEHVWKVKPNSWQSHIFDEAHIDAIAIHHIFELDPSLFVNKFIDLAKLPPTRQDHQQTLTSFEYGAEFVIKNELAKKYECTICQVVLNDVKQCIQHAKTYEHAKKAIQYLSPNVVPFIWNARDEKEQQDIVFDYLQHAYVPIERKMRVYDPIVAYSLNCMSEIPKILIDLAGMEPEKRQEFVGTHKDSSDFVGFNMALRTTNIEILQITKEVILLWCQDCRQTFSVFLDSLDTIWTEHLLAKNHWRRKEIFSENQMNENYKQKIFSLYNVKQFKQDFGAKKLTWKWNTETKTYAFVLLQLTQGVVERRHYPVANCQIEDLFCTLCGMSISLDDAQLELHVRSFAHVFNYVHKYHPYEIPELEDLLLEPSRDIDDLSNKRKDIRRYLAKVLKNIDSKYMPIFAYDYEPKSYKFDSLKAIVSAEIKGYKNQVVQRNRFDESGKNLWHYLPLEDKKVDVESLKLNLNEDDLGSSSIEGEKFKMLNETIFSEYTASNDAKPARSSQSPPRAKSQEKEVVRKRRNITPTKEIIYERPPEPNEEPRPIPILANRTIARNSSGLDVPSNSWKPQSDQEPPVSNLAAMSILGSIFNQSTPVVSTYGTPSVASSILGAPPMITSSIFRSTPMPSAYGIPSNVGGTIGTSVGPKLADLPTNNVWSGQPIMSTMTSHGSMSNLSGLEQSKEPTLKEKADFYQKELRRIKDITGLVDYIKAHGSEPIPEDEQLLFNEMIQLKKGALNAKSLYQIVCYEHPEMETYYCGLCDYWTTVSEMFGHLISSEHRMKYMFRDYKGNYSKIMAVTSARERKLLIRTLSEQIWKFEGAGKCQNRMKVVLNESDFRRLWPDYENFVDNSWKIAEIIENEELDVDSRRSPTPPPDPVEQMEDLKTKLQNSFGISLDQFQNLPPGERDRHHDEIMRALGPLVAGGGHQKEPSKYSRLSEPQKPAPVPSQPPDTRRMLGLMVKIQNLVDQWGQIDEETLQNMCQESEVPIQEVFTNPIYKHIQDKIMRDPSTQAGSSSGAVQMPNLEALKSLGLSAAQLAKIIDKVHEVTGKPVNVPSGREAFQSSGGRGSYGFGNSQDQDEGEEYSFVYPTKDDVTADQDYAQYGYDQGYRGTEDQIDNRISNLTFAFGGPRKPFRPPAPGPRHGNLHRPPLHGMPYGPQHGTPMGPMGPMGRFPRPAPPSRFPDNLYQQYIGQYDHMGQPMPSDAPEPGQWQSMPKNQAPMKKKEPKKKVEPKKMEESGDKKEDKEQEEKPKSPEKPETESEPEEMEELPEDGKEKSKKIKMNRSMGALLASLKQKDPEKAQKSKNKVYVPDLASKGMRKRKREAEKKRLTELLETELSPEERTKVKDQLEKLGVEVDSDTEEGETRESSQEPEAKKSRQESNGSQPQPEKLQEETEAEEYRRQFSAKWTSYVELAHKKCRDPSVAVILGNITKIQKSLPKNEEKFLNFLKNSQKIVDPSYGKLIWSAIYKEYEKDPNRMEFPKEVERQPKEKKPKDPNVPSRILQAKKEGDTTEDERKFLNEHFMSYIQRASFKCRDPQTRSVLSTMSKQWNVPKTEDKFVNFLKNSHNIQDLVFAKKIWKAVMSEAELDRNPATRNFMTNAMQSESTSVGNYAKSKTSGDFSPASVPHQSQQHYGAPHAGQNSSGWLWNQGGQDTQGYGGYDAQGYDQGYGGPQQGQYGSRGGRGAKGGDRGRGGQRGGRGRGGPNQGPGRNGAQNWQNQGYDASESYGPQSGRGGHKAQRGGQREAHQGGSGGQGQSQNPFMDPNYMQYAYGHLPDTGYGNQGQYGQQGQAQGSSYGQNYGQYGQQQSSNIPAYVNPSQNQFPQPVPKPVPKPSPLKSNFSLAPPPPPPPVPKPGQGNKKQVPPKQVFTKVAEQVGNDWDALGSQLDNLFNQF